MAAAVVSGPQTNGPFQEGIITREMQDLLNTRVPQWSSSSGTALVKPDGTTSSVPSDGSVLVPQPPTNVQAFAGTAQVTVTWLAPKVGAPTGYTVTLSPGGATATVAGTSATVTGLTNGTTYTASVVATNAAGNSTAATAGNTATPQAAGTGVGQLPAALSGVTTGNLFAWYAASQLVSNPGNGNPIANGNGGTGIFINDASGNGRNITVAAAPPTYVTGFRNSTVAFGFNGSTQYLLLPFDCGTFYGQVAIFIVFDVASADAAGNILIGNFYYDGVVNFTNNFKTWHCDTYAASNAGLRAIGVAGGVLSAATGFTVGVVGTASVQVASMPWGGPAGGALYVNGTKQAGPLTAIPQLIQNFVIGARASADNRFFNGRIAEVVLFTGSMSDADRHTVEAYLGTKYNVTMAVQ